MTMRHIGDTYNGTYEISVDYDDTEESEYRRPYKVSVTDDKRQVRMIVRFQRRNIVSLHHALTDELVRTATERTARAKFGDHRL